MRTPHIYLLPGMDGTGRLLGDFCAAILNRESDSNTPIFDATILSLPTDLPNTYDDLTTHFSEKLFRPFASEKYVIIAESFSGPLAVKLATANQGRLAALVLVATFLKCPAPSIARVLPWSLMFRFPPPEFAVKRLMVGHNAPSKTVEMVRETVNGISPSILAQRMRSVLSVDVRREYSQLAIPTFFVEAAHDRMVSRNIQSLLSAQKQDTEFAIVDGHHLLLQTKPDETWEEIQRFLVRHAV